MGKTAVRNAVLGGLLGAVGTISLLTLAARGLGFVRWFAQSAWVGTSAFANAYASANQIPNVCYEIVAGGALAGMTIPLLAKPIAKGDRQQTSELASTLLTWALLILVPLSVVIIVFAPQIVSLLPTPAGTDRQSQIWLMSTFLRIFAPQIPLYGICVVLGGVLQAHEKFFFPALTPLLSSLVVICTYALFGWLSAQTAELSQISGSALQVLAWGTTLGVVALSLPMLIPVRGLGLRLRPRLRMPKPQARRAISLGAAGISTLVAQEISVLVIMVVARQWGGSGTLPIYQYAQAVYLLPYAILAVPISTALFPRLNKSLQLGDQEGFIRATRSSTVLVGLVGVLGMGLILVEAYPAQAVFQKLNPVPGMASGLLAMAPGIFGFGLIYQLTRVLYALGRGRIIAFWTSVAWLIVSAGSLLLAWALDGYRSFSAENTTMVALGLAGSLGMLVGAGGMLRGLERVCAQNLRRSFVPSVLPAALLTALVSGGINWGLTFFFNAEASIWVIILLAVGLALVILTVNLPFLWRFYRRS